MTKTKYSQYELSQITRSPLSSQPARPADLVLNALGEDVDHISVKTFASLVSVYESLTMQHASSPARLMHEKSRLSRMHANEKVQINSSDITKGVKDAINELQQYKNNAKEYDTNTNKFI